MPHFTVFFEVGHKSRRRQTGNVSEYSSKLAMGGKSALLRQVADFIMEVPIVRFQLFNDVVDTEFIDIGIEIFVPVVFDDIGKVLGIRFQLSRQYGDRYTSVCKMPGGFEAFQLFQQLLLSA